MTWFDNHMAARAPALTVRGRERETRWLANAGLGIMATAFAWWFLFYAQWTGPLHLLDLKVPCLVTTLGECSFFQSRLDAFHAAGPAYHPVALWIGLAAFAAGRVSRILLPAVATLHSRMGMGLGLSGSEKDGALRD